jgi:hypothetical protein
MSCGIKNTGTSELEFLVPPAGMFSQLRILSQGAVLEQIQEYSRTVATHAATLPREASILNGEEAMMPMKDPWGNKEPAYAEGRTGQTKMDATAAAEAMFVSGGGGAAEEEEHRVRALPHHRPRGDEDRVLLNTERDTKFSLQLASHACKFGHRGDFGGSGV